jgi:uncharacterized protein YjeT (DUF2065 family)
MNQFRTPVGRSILVMVAANSIFLTLNGLFMIADPKTWYEIVPGVINTGFYNQHFIRDIGIVQLLLGIAFVAGCFRPRERLVLWGAATIWLIAHAIFHLWEVAVGICGPSTLLRDFPAVTLPAIIGVVAITFLRISNRAGHQQPDG